MRRVVAMAAVAAGCAAVLAAPWMPESVGSLPLTLAAVLTPSGLWALADRPSRRPRIARFLAFGLASSLLLGTAGSLALEAPRARLLCTLTFVWAVPLILTALGFAVTAAGPTDDPS